MYKLWPIHLLLISSTAALTLANSTLTSPQIGAHSKEHTPFEPCLGTNKLTAARRGRAVKLSTNILSECGFKIVSSTHYVWHASVVDCIPFTLKRFCLIYRVAYDFYSDRPGHLPSRIARQSSIVFEIVEKILRLYGDEDVFGTKICCENLPLNRTSCFPRKPMMEFLRLFFNCGRQSVKNVLPDLYEEMTAGAIFGTRKLMHSGVLKFMLG